MDQPIDPSDNHSPRSGQLSPRSGQLSPRSGHTFGTADRPGVPQTSHDADALLDAPTAKGSHVVDPAGERSSTGSSPSGALDAKPFVGDWQPTVTAPLPGHVIGDYELVREIARGGMGVVFLAKQIPLNRLVALKMILEGDGADEAELKRFENEARAAGSLTHPGIVPVIEVGSFNGCPFYSMGYVDGDSLASLISNGPLPPRRAAEIALDVARAIAHAHDNAIIHRDIKPANILIDSSGSPKVTDFGVCKSLASQSHLTSHGELIGTPHYMPPEQAGTPGAIIGPASDVYSIGAVLYAMLTARPPFQAPSPIDVIAQVMTKDPVSPQHLTSGIPTDLETIVIKCLCKSARDRYATAQLLADDLKRFLHGEPIMAKPPGLIKLVLHSIRQHVFLASVSGSLAIILVLVSMVLGLALLQSRAQINQLTELLKVERVGVRRLVKDDPEGIPRVLEYDVRRLSDAAEAASEQDRQLALHLGIYAGRLALKHELSPPEKLETVLTALSNDADAKGQPPQDLSSIMKSAESQITRELTEFERTAYGLFDDSHQVIPQPVNDSDQQGEKQ